MIYKKPKGLSYCDMAKLIDNNAYKEDVDNEKLFEYLYHIFFMLSSRRKFFKSLAYYDDFSAYAASLVYRRYKNAKQFLPDDDPKKLRPVKSALNYCKDTLYPKKVDYENWAYSQVISAPNECVEYDTSLHFRNRVQESIDELSRAEFSCCLHDIAKSCKVYLKKIPYYSDKKLLRNIYISCLLSLLNSMTPPNKLKDEYSKKNLSADDLFELYKGERDNSTVLYHLDESFYDYIKVLTNETRHVVANDLKEILQQPVAADSYEESVMLSELFCTGEEKK